MVQAKRKLSDIDFSQEGCHIALVSKEQGHGANGHHYALVMKATNFSDDFLEKATKVKVEMDIVDYMVKFFGMYEDDAEVLAAALGYKSEDAEEYPEYSAWLDEKVKSVEIIKSLIECEDVSKGLEDLSESDYLQLLQDQEIVEKAFKKIEKGNKDKDKKYPKTKKAPVKDSATSSESVSKAGEDASTNASVEKSGESTPVVKRNKGNMTMTDNVQVIEQEVEVIAKSQFDEIQKAFDSQKEELQKALDLVNELKKEKQEAIAKARKSRLAEILGDKADVIMKAVGESDDTTFDEVVKVFQDITKATEETAMFNEVGATVEDEHEAPNYLANLIKAKYNK